MASNAQYLDTEHMELQERMARAVAYCLDPKNTLSYAEIARLYDIPASTLGHRVNGRRTHEDAAADQQLLSPLEEQLIVDYCERFIAHGFPPQVSMVKKFAECLVAENQGESSVSKATGLVPYNPDTVLQKLPSSPAPEEEIHPTTPRHRGSSGIPITPRTVPQITSHMDTILKRVEASPNTEKRLRQLSKVATYSHSHNVLLQDQNKTLLEASQQRKKRSRKVLTTEGRLLTKDVALGLRAEEDRKEAEKARKRRHREIRAEYKKVLLEKAKAKGRKTVERSKLLILPYVAVPEDEISTDSESTDSEASEKL